MERIKSINWKKHIKRAIIGVVVLGVIGAAGTGVIISKELDRRANVEAAQSKIIEAKAKELDKKLLTEDEIKQKVSESIGVSKDEITFDKISLISGDGNGYGKKGHRYKDDDNDIDDILEDRVKEKFGIYDDDDHDHERNHYRNEQIEGKRLDITQEKQNAPAEEVQSTEAQPTETVATEATDEQQVSEEQTSIQEPKATENAEISAEAQNFKPLYFVKCSANGVKYRLVLNAETGEIL